MLSVHQELAGAFARKFMPAYANEPEREMVESSLAPPEPSDAVVLSVKDFKIRLADTAAGRNSASMLIDKMYSWRGYAGRHVVQPGPNRITLTAYMKDELIGTVTLAIDSEIGLLADEIFQDQLDRCRGPGRKLCELTKLAVDAKVDSKFALASLFHICFIYARRLHGCTDVFIEVNPRHRGYYERVLGFKRLGDLKTNPRVSAPAFLLWLDLDFVEEQILKHGGTSDQAGSSRSLYPYFFSPREEVGITQRLINLN